MESRLKDLETSIASTIEAISKQQTEQLRLEALALAENELALLVGKRWQRAVLDEVLAEITAETNRILAYIPNTADFTISFETVERGEERDVIQRIWVGGVERSDPECMSGGQKSSIELASDLAVSTVLTARGLSRLQWMVLDEPFDGMGDVDRAAFVDLLRERLTLFLVSAHNPEFTEDFRLSGIGLEFDGEFARIVSDQERAKSSW
jgi:DNA repair exonuclease SbcCD ATPase subunit